MQKWRKWKFVCLRRRMLAALGCIAGAALILLAVSHPAVVGASATQRQLPIYCVAKDHKVVSLSFDAAWADGRVR